MERILTWLRALASFTLVKALPAVTICVIGILTIRLAMKILETALEKAKMERALCKLICSVAKVALYILLSLVVASNLGIDVTGVVALASVLTLAISLSVQTALTNVIGGFTLLYTKPFVTGDFVEIAGQSGTVKEVGLTYTKLITADNKIVSIPNSAVTAAEIVNYTVIGTRRVDVQVSVSYTAPAQTVLEALKKSADVATALQDPAPFVAVHSYKDSAVVYILQLWCKTDDYWTTLFKANENVKNNLDEKGIQMTCVDVNIHMEK